MYSDYVVYTEFARYGYAQRRSATINYARSDVMAYGGVVAFPFRTLQAPNFRLSRAGSSMKL